MESFDLFHLVFFDLETTALSVYDANILEIGALYPNGITSFHSYVQYFGSIDNSHIHNITQETLNTNQARPLVTVLTDFETWIRERFNDQTDVYLMAHNGIGYDKPVLELAYKRLGRPMPGNWHFADSLPQIKRLFRMPSYKLGAIYQHFFNEPLVGAHGAMADTRALYRVYLHAINEAFYRHDTPEIHLPQYDGMSRNVIGTAIYMNFLLGDHNFIQKSVYHPQALRQPIETIGVTGYPLQRIKQSGYLEIKDLLILYLVVYPNFRSNLEMQVGVTSQYHITKINAAKQYFAHVLLNVVRE